MSAIRRSENNDVNFGRVIPELRCRFKYSGLWMRILSLRLSFGIARNDRRNLQPGGRLDQRSVKDRPRDSVSNEPNAK